MRLKKTSSPKLTDSQIGFESVFEGVFYVRGKMKIYGSFKGELKVEDSLYLDQKGRIESDVVSKKSTIAGKLKGNILSEDEVKILSSGNIEGNVITGSFFVQKGGASKGGINITGVGDLNQKGK